MTASIWVKNGVIQTVGIYCIPPGAPPCDQGIAYHEDCCPCGCWDFYDTFTRQNNTDLGPGWVEDYGNWEIKDLKLWEEGTPGAFIYGTGKVSVFSAGEMHVTAVFRDAAVGMIYEIYAAYDSDTNTFFKTEHEKLIDGRWKTTLYNNGVYVNEIIQTPAPHYYPDAAQGYICVEKRGNVKAGVLSLEEHLWEVELGGKNGREFGLGHQNNVETWFDDFYVTELRTATEVCDRCFCPCCLNFIQKDLVATFTDAIGRADCLDGIDVPLTWDFNDLGRWGAEYTYVGSGNLGGYWNFRLACDATEDPECTGQNWKLSIQSQCAYYLGMSCGAGCVVQPNSELSTCDPLYLVYGPFTIDYFNLGCAACYMPLSGPLTGSYYIVITEA